MQVLAGYYAKACRSANHNYITKMREYACISTAVLLPQTKMGGRQTWKLGKTTNSQVGNRQLTAYEEELTFTKRNANKAHLNRCFYMTSISRATHYKATTARTSTSN